MVLCKSCGRYSTRVYRCNVVVDRTRDGEPIECGADLAKSNTPVEPFRYRSVAGERDDGLVEVEFRRICCRCGSEQFVATDYCDVPVVIRYLCQDCGRPTKHRPTDEDVRYLVHYLDLPDEDLGDDQQSDEQRSDQPTVSTPA